MILSIARTAKRSFISTRRKLENIFFQPLLVLIYHRIADLQSDPQQLAVTPDNFRDQLRYLKSEFSIVGFEDDWTALDRPTVVLTFDDGYEDNLLNASPILQDEGVPCTFFISTGLIDTKEEFWWDELERLFLVARDYPSVHVVFGDQTASPSRDQAARQRLYQRYHPLLKAQSVAGRKAVLDYIREWAGLEKAGRSTHRILSSAQLLQLSRIPGVTIGAHTQTHTALSSLSVDEQRQDIVESKRYLEALLDKPVRSFSYPFGSIGDYTDDSVAICKQAGFDRVASNFAGIVRPWTTDYQVPRVLVRNWSGSELCSMLKAYV